MALPNPRYPHTQGITRLAYTPNGEFLFTVGSNMLARRFVVGDTSSEPDTIDLEKPGIAVACNDSVFVVAGDSGVVRIYDNDTLEFKAYLTRQAVPIRQIEFSGDGKYIAIAGDDCAKIVSADDIADIRTLPPTSGLVRYLTFHPKNAYVAASCMDGVVRVYSGDKLELVHSLESIVPTIKDVEDDRTTAVAWSPDGKHFAVPNKTFDVIVYGIKDNWLEEFRFVEGHNNAITDLKWSPNGRYLATAGRDAKVLVWDATKRSLIKTFEGVDGPLELAWHPHKNELSISTNLGKLYSLSDVLDEIDLPPFGEPVLIGGPAIGASKRTESDYEEDLFGDMERSGSSDVEIYDEPPRKRTRSHSPATISVAPKVIAFQSGSTPWEAGKRYLCMNSLGYVWTLRQDNDHNSVTIQFFNQDKHREVHFSDADRFDLAALGEEATIFANSKTGKVAMRFHGSFTDNWERTFPEGVRSIGLSDRVVVLCMQNGLVRSFSLYGAPLMVSRHSRDSVVSCSAFENLVVIVRSTPQGLYTYTLEDGVSGEYLQKDDTVDVPAGAGLTALFFNDTADPCIMDTTGVVSTLINWRQPGQARWIPVFDSHEAAQENQRTYWPLAVTGSKLICVLLKGQQRYPPVPLPLHDEVDLCMPGYAGTAATGTAAEPSLEGKYLLEKTLYAQLSSRAEQLVEGCDEETRDILEQELQTKALENDKLILRLFREACNDKRSNRSLDLASQIRNPESLEAAVKIALYFGLRTLADRINQLAESLS